MSAKLSPAMCTALRTAYSSTWTRKRAWVCPPGTRFVTIKAMRKRGLCRSDGELSPAGEAERARLLESSQDPS